MDRTMPIIYTAKELSTNFYSRLMKSWDRTNQGYRFSRHLLAS